MTQSHICIFSGLQQRFLLDDGSILRFILRLNIEAQNVHHEKKNNRVISGCLQSSEVADQLLRINTRQEHTSEEQSPEILKHNILPLTQPFEVTIFSETKWLLYRTHSLSMSGLSRGKWGWTRVSLGQQGSRCKEPTAPPPNTTSVQTVPRSSCVCFHLHHVSWSCSIN